LERPSEWNAFSLFRLKLSLFKKGIVAKLWNRLLGSAMTLVLLKLFEERLSSTRVLKKDRFEGKVAISLAAISRICKFLK